MAYKKFSRKQLERELCLMKEEGYFDYRPNGLCYYEATENFKNRYGVATEEVIFEIPTPNNFVNVVIYTSIPVGENNKARDRGQDAVRIGLRWYLKGTNYYRNIATRNRVDGLFTNLRKSIELAIQEADGMQTVNDPRWVLLNESM